MDTQTEIKVNQIICGDNREKLKEFPDNTFSGVVTDPPYEMNFMRKSWDASGIAYLVELWKEVLRTAKPGSFLFCFGGTRTFHRVVCAIEDAGWIIKDQMMWLYGEGFPKSTNISKQLDKEAGVEREVIGCESVCRNRPITSKWKKSLGKKDSGPFETSSGLIVDITAPATNDAKRWDGYGTGLKPGWEPIIVAMKPLEKGLTYAQNAKKWGVAGLNIDGGRIAAQQGEYDIRHYIKEDCFINDKPKESKFQVKPQPQGRWPSNVILSHSPDCVYVGTKIINEGKEMGKYNSDESSNENHTHILKNLKSGLHYSQETIEVYACVPDCPIRIMDGQSGQSQSIFNKGSGKINGSIGYVPNNRVEEGYSDSGGASRFFYCAKAKRSEKEAGLLGFVECVKCGKFDSKEHTIIVDGEKKKEKCCRNNHPTVKPLDLMKYLCNLIKMPNEDQVILDPFCGSGTTLIACEQLGISYIGIDQDLDSVLTSIARIDC